MSFTHFGLLSVISACSSYYNRPDGTSSKTSASGVRDIVLQIPSRSNLSHVANGSPPLQSRCVGPGAKLRSCTAHSWHPKWY